MAPVRTIIAVTGEDDRYGPIRQQATGRALEEHATLILYDLDAGRDPLESPLPTEWSAEGDEEAVGDRLGPDELEAAGRAAIAVQVRAARAAGVDAWGWLPDNVKKETLLAYAARQPSPLIMVPDDEPDLVGDLSVTEAVVHADRR
jgi:hypothetical protein